MLASSNPTRAPFRASATARFALTVDFPTPPFPDATARTFRTPGTDFRSVIVALFWSCAISVTSLSGSGKIDYSPYHVQRPRPTDGARRRADDGVGVPLPDPGVRPRRRDRLPARRHAGDGRLLRRLHDPRLPQLPAGGGIPLHHLHPHFRAVSCGREGGGGIPLLLRHRHGDGDRHALLHRAGGVPRGTDHPPHRPRLPARAGGGRGPAHADRPARADLLLH